VTYARNVLLVAALAVVLGGLVAAPEHPSPWSFALAAAVATVVYLPRQRFRVGATSFLYGWCEAALIVALHLVPAGWAPLAVAVGYLAYTGIKWLRDRNLPLAGVPAQAANHTVSAGVGALLCSVVADPYGAPPTPAVTGGLLLAALGYFSVMQVTGAGLVRLRARVSIWRVYERVWRYELPMFGGSVAIGLTAVAAAYSDWRWLLLLPALLWLVNWTYAFRVKSGEQRRMWSALTAATRALNRPDEESVAAAGIKGALAAFTVGRAELEIWRQVRGAPVAQSWSVPLKSGLGQGDRNGSRRAWAGDQTGQIYQFTPNGEVGGTVVPLQVLGDEVGQLRVHFPAGAGPNSGERAALQVYADALAAALNDTATHEELHKVLARSIHDAQHDPLTGLLNRSALLARGETAVQLLPHAQPVALLLVNVDHFREINDTLGHAAGDEVLAVTAERLRAAVRPGDLLGRLGGDEFALLATGSTEEFGGPEHNAIRRGRELVRRLADEATISGVPVSVEASVGVVVAPAGTADVTELLRRADAAMHQAKHGGGTVGWYDVTQDEGSSDRPAMLAELRDALDRDDELVLVLQPVLELATGAPTSVEALVRWRHPRRGLVPPADFVRAVENSDLLGTFTEYVIDKALEAAARWAKRGPAVPVAVNLSARSLLDPRLPQAVAALLRKHRVPGRRLVLEITETVVTSDLPGVDQALTNLRALGVRLAVDDFGTGYASLTFLTRMPLDEVKVDGSFVTQMAESPEATAIIRATVELGRELGMQVVAEGVETAAQRHQLTTLGCPAGQGFHLALPTSVDRIGETLHRLDVAATRAEVVPLTPDTATHPA
jgi:diguanylate cyclase (GGDEF)-like protein